MSRVLILSKNPVVDQPLQSLLQRINIEVFSSTDFFYQANSYTDFIEHFSLLIISDTIPTVELEHNISTLSNCNIQIFRRGDKRQIEKTDCAWLESVIDGWISVESSNSEIIEKVSRAIFSNGQLNRSDNSDIINQDNFKFSKQNYLNLVHILSRNEKAVLLSLYNGDGSAVSRSKLCMMIWGSETSSSQLSQLSSLIRRINLKLVDVGFENQLCTKWKEGYYLGKELLFFLKKYNF